LIFLQTPQPALCSCHHYNCIGLLETQQIFFKPCSIKIVNGSTCSLQPHAKHFQHSLWQSLSSCVAHYASKWR